MIEKDVVVIGAGPVGSIAAREVAKQNVDVLLIDMKSEIGAPKRCAEGVYEIGLKRLDIELNDRWVANTIYSGTIHSPDGNSFLAPKEVMPMCGYILERKVFDKHMAMDAARAGAQIMIKTRADSLRRVDDGFIITCETISGTIEIKAKIIIAADGPSSQIGKMAGLDVYTPSKFMMSCAQYEMCNIEVDKENLDFYMGSTFANGGYAWIFPKGDDIANVGVGITGETTETALKTLDKFVKSCPQTKNGQIVELNVGGDPVSGVHEEIYSDNILICGDAAGQVDPIEGGGLILGMQGGMAAGRTAADAIKEQDCSKEKLKEYIELYDELTHGYVDKLPPVRDVLLSLNDDDFNRLVNAANQLDLSNVTATDFMKVFLKLSPRTSLKFSRLFKILL